MSFLNTLLPHLLSNMATNNASATPGQESRPLPSLSGLMNSLLDIPQNGQKLAQQQQLQQQAALLSPKPGGIDPEFDPNGTPPSLQEALNGRDPTAGMVDPRTWTPGMLQGGSGAQRQQVSSQGPFTSPQEQSQGAVDPVTGQPIQSQGAANWASLLSPVGTMQNPNALVRMGVGYNHGGLLGALGYLLTDMSQNNQQF